MECKFKQISYLDGGWSLPVHSSQSAAKGAIDCLIGNVGEHFYNKKAIEKSKTFLKNKLMSLEVDSVKQIYQTRPCTAYLTKEQQSPRKGVADCMRPLSAQIRRFSRKNQRSTINSESRRTIESHIASLKGIYRSKINTTGAIGTIEGKKNSKKNYYNKNHENQKKFFAVQTTCEEDDENMDFIEEMRIKKRHEENQARKKQQFLKSIQFDSTTYSSAQNKFIQSFSRKKFIYGHQGEVIQINGTSQKMHLKKISAMSKSRVQIKSKFDEDFRNSHQSLKENIYVEFKGRQNYQSRPQTSKPNNSEKTQQNQNNNHNNDNPCTTREQKKPTQLSKKRKTQVTKSGQKTPYNRDIRGSTQNDKTGVKKKVQKILFYPSPNTIYRVINEGTLPPTNHALTVEDV